MKARTKQLVIAALERWLEPLREESGWLARESLSPAMEQLARLNATRIAELEVALREVEGLG